MSLNTLPYDLLFNIAQYLAIDDIHNLQATCKSLRTFTLTRPVYRALAHGLLARSRPLPLPAFQRLSDLSTRNLIKAVDRAHSFEKAWRVRAPRPARTSFSLSGSGPPSASSDKPGQWYTKISAPPNEEIDWLSPITSSYTLCATKSGRVICWDVARDVCLAEWDPRTLSAQCGGGEQNLKDGHKPDRRRLKEEDDDDDEEGGQVDGEKKWELWKCRVEFDERAVYFTMARVLEGSYDDNRVMEFVLMKLAFPPEVHDYYPSPMSQTLSFTPESHCCSPSKSPANSPPPSSQGSSPRDSTLLAYSVTTDSAYSSRSPLSRTTSPLPDCTECGRETPTSTLSVYPSPSGGRLMHLRGSLRAGILFDPPSQPTLERKPVFFPLTSFHTTGVVMNVFLLDPPRRLLSAFVWVASSNTIGLYVLLDWAKDEYVFVDTGVGCLISSNWSCILHEDQIVIHSEEADAAYQHFYPLSILRNYVKPRKPSLLANRIHNHDCDTTVVQDSSASLSREFHRDDLPMISIRLSPVKSISKKFVFPSVHAAVGAGAGGASSHDDDDDDDDGDTTSGHASGSVQDVEEQLELGGSPASNETDAQRHDGSEYGAEDDDGWSQEAVAERSRSKGKARAVSEDNVDVVDEDEPRPSRSASSTIAKDKGEMRDVDAKRGTTQAGTFSGSGSGSHHGSPSSVHASSPNASSSSSSSTVTPTPSPALSHNPANTTTTTTTTAASSPAPAPPPLPAPNPYPFPPWYPESAHFVRQWWPTLPGVPRLSCTVVLLAAHDPDTHRTRFVLAQHYFRVPIVGGGSSHTSRGGGGEDETEADKEQAEEEESDDEMLHLWYVSTPFEVVCVLDGASENEDDEEAGDRPRPLVAVDFGHAVWIEYAAEPGGVYGVDASRLVGHAAFEESDGEGESGDEDGDSEDEGLFGGMLSEDGGSRAAFTSNGVGGRRRDPSGRSGSESTTTNTTSSTTNTHDGDGTIYDPRRHRVPKCLRFVTFPPVFTAVERRRVGKGKIGGGMRSGGRGGAWREEAVVRTLEIPDELDLDGVETINIDQSQGAVILSVKEGKIFILRYE